MISFGTVEAMINLDDIMDHIDDKINDKAKLAMDAEITKQFETIQGELEHILKSYIKDVMEGKL